jgi:PAS domain S-box-containing protein
METTAPPARFRSLLPPAAVSLLYGCAILAGRRFSPGPAGLPFLWPASGVLLAGLLALPPRARGRLFAAAAAAGLAAELASGTGIPAAASHWLSDLAEAALLLFLALRLPGGAGFLGNLPGTVRFFTQVIPLGAAAGALLHAVPSALFLGTGWLRPPAVSFLADAAGLAVMVPAALAWTRRDQAWDAAGARSARFGLCAALALGAAYLTEAQPAWLVSEVGRPLPYATFPFLLWAALDFGVRGAAAVHLAIYLLGACLDAAGKGPYLVGQRLGMGLVGPLQWYPYFAAFCTVAPAVLLRRQKRVEEELRLRESRYGKLWTSKMVGIYICDLKGRILEANDTFLAMLGMDRAELEQGESPLLSMATPEHRARTEEIREKIRTQGHLGPFEREWVLKDGKRLQSMVYAARMDEPDRALGMVMDIRELDQARKDLRLRDSRYRALLSSSIVGIFVTTLEGRIVEANDTFLALIRRTRGDLEAGRIHSREMASPEYVAGAAERQRQFERDGRMGPFDREWLLRDGTRLNTLFFATRLEDGDALCMVFDTNELKRTQMELRAVETRFKTLLDANILGVAVFDESYVAQEANDAFLAMTGYARADLESGRLSAHSLGASRPPGMNEARNRILTASGRIAPQETEWTRKDGKLVTVFRGITRLEESDRWLTVALDLTELKRTQAELEEAKAAAEAASVAKSDFLAHMSHEIRTPLNGLLGMLALLLDSRLNAEQAGYARAARESGAHLLALINQILDFSKIERGHMDLDREPFAVSAAVDTVLSFLEEPARKKGIVLAKRVEPGVPARIVGDATRLRQILLNLAGNAVKFSSGGTVAVSARLLERNGPLCRLGFEVSDEGPGIAPAAMARLFQPFRQGDDSMTRAAGGTGLGLAISRELARLMGGDVEAESIPGKGSRFRFRIEAEACDDDAAPAGASAEAPTAGFVPGGPLWARPPLVLVADDHPVNVNVASIMLRKLGCEVDAFPDGNSALAAASGKDYALIFMDCQMPGLDGFEATRRLRAAEAAGKGSGRVPVVALTAHAVAGMREKCLAAGMDDYLTKPFSAEDIEAMVRKWLPARAADAPAGEILLDESRLSALDDGTPQGKENTRRLVEMFITSSRESLERIRADHRSGDGQALAKSLHRLKGSCATVGAVAMTEKLKAIEAALRSAPPAALDGDLAALEGLFARTEAAMARIPARSPA